MAIMSNGRNRVSLLFCRKLYAKRAITRETSISVKINIIRSKIAGTLDLPICTIKMKMHLPHYHYYYRRHTWKCPICDTCYDNTEIEFSLIDRLNRKSMGYVLQDLQCRKCKEIKRENMNLLCSCSGEYDNLISRDEIITFINICKSIASKCKMTILTEIADNTKLFTS